MSHQPAAQADTVGRNPTGRLRRSSAGTRRRKAKRATAPTAQAAQPNPN